MSGSALEEQRRLSLLRSLHARSAYAQKPLIVVGQSPNRILYVANRVVIEYSDDGGTSWLTWPGTENGIETDEAQQAKLYDYDFPLQFRRFYRTYGLGELAETSPALLHVEPTDYVVQELHYQIIDLPSLRRLSDTLPEQALSLPGFTCAISGRSLIASPLDTCGDVRTARAEFEAQAERWRFEAETLGGHAFGLQFQRSQCKGKPGGALWQIVRTQPSEPTTSFVAPPVELLAPSTGAALTTSGTVEKIRDRLNRGLRQREPIAALVYWEREILEAHFAGAPQACAALNVSANLWQEIGRLTAQHDWREGRKVAGELTDRPLHRRETLFLSVACRHLLHRLALAEGGMTPSDKLTKQAVQRAATREFEEESPFSAGSSG